MRVLLANYRRVVCHLLGLGLIACQPSNSVVEPPSPLSDAQLTRLLKPLVPPSDSAYLHIGARHDTLALSGNGQLYDEDPAGMADLTRLMACFEVPPVVYDTLYPGDVHAFPVKVLRSASGSVLYWEPALGVVRARIRREGISMPRGLRVGMGRAEFFRRFFRRYDSALDAYNVVELPGGLGWNCTTFTLAAGKLQQVEEVREPE